MGDLIDRKTAIDALNGEIEITGRTNAEAVKGYVRLVKDRLERLPSAQPEITHCAECIHWKHSDVRKNYCEVFDWMNTAEDFCSFAERRSDGN